MFKFRKPQVNLKLIKGGSEVKMTLVNINIEKTLIVIYSAISQLATIMKVDRRHLMNKIVDLDKKLVKFEKNKNKKNYK